MEHDLGASVLRYVHFETHAARAEGTTNRDRLLFTRINAENWLFDHDATKGECTQRNSGNLDVAYGGTDDEDDLFCVKTYNESPLSRKSPHVSGSLGQHPYLPLRLSHNVLSLSSQTVEVIYPEFEVSDFRDEIEEVARRATPSHQPFGSVHRRGLFYWGFPLPPDGGRSFIPAEQKSVH